jgi:hypothetical protein
LKAVEKLGGGGKRIRVSNGRGWTDQNSITPMIINLDSINERKDCEIGSVCVKGYLWEVGGWKKEIKIREYDQLTAYTYMK